MTTPECTQFDILKFTIAVIVITFFLLTFRKYFKKVNSQRWFGAQESAKDSGIVFSSFEIADALKFKDYVLQLQDLSRKVSDDKAVLSQFGEADSFPFNDTTLIEVSKKYSLIQDRINATLEETQRCTNKQFDESQRAMEVFKGDFLEFKNQLVDVLSVLASRYKEGSFVESGSHKCLKENMTQMNHPEQSCAGKEEQFLNELCKIDNIKIILLAIKNTMYKIIEESRYNWKKTVLEISTFLAQYYQDIKTQLDTSIQINAEKNDALMATFARKEIEAADIEKQLFDIFLSLDRQLLGVQAVFETLKFFNRKFINFAERCNVKWESLCKRHERACLQIQDAQNSLDVNSSKMTDVSCYLPIHLPELNDLLNQLENVLQKVGTLSDSEDSNRKYFVFVVASIEDMRNMLVKIDRGFCSRLSYLSEALKRPSEQLESVLQTIVDLEVLNDLVKSIANAYTNTVTSPSGNNILKDNHSFDSSISLNDSNRFQLTGTPQGELMDSCRDTDDATELSFDDRVDSKKHSDNKALKNSPSRQIISILDDVISKTKSKITKKKSIRIHKKITSSASSEKAIGSYDKEKDGNVWRCNSSDITLNATGSECAGSSSSEE